VTHGHMLREKLVRVLYCPVGRAHPDLPPDAPTIVELATMTRTARSAPVRSQSDLGRTIVAGPGVRRPCPGAADGVAAMSRIPFLRVRAARHRHQLQIRRRVTALVAKPHASSQTVIERARSVTGN